MASMSTEDVTLLSGEKGPEGERVKLVRIKRKRDVNTPEEIYVQASSTENEKRGGSHELTDYMKSLELSNEGNVSRSKRIKRFNRLATMTASELSAASKHELETLLRQPLMQSKDGQKRKISEEHCREFHFEQYRNVRGRTMFESTENEPDPLKSFGTVYDVICSESMQGKGEALPSNGAFMGRRTDTAALECRESDSGEYVYDLYIVDDAELVSFEGLSQPILHLDDGHIFMHEMSDKEDSDYDTEDSNAEGFYTNDYPEDEEWSFGSQSSSSSHSCDHLGSESDGLSEDYY
eukprot:jgi/Picsp_1/5471/NSC_02830-R1_female sterile isoform a